MIKTDCHMHTSFSSDSEEPMEMMIKGAINKGLDSLCFTEHMDLEFPKKYELSFVFDIDEYMDCITWLSGKYRDRIRIFKGIEIGLKPNLSDQYDRILSSYDWDFVIGSTHLVDNIDPYYDEYWEGKDEKTRIYNYFECIYKNISACNNYDSLGHLDYILRYAPSKGTDFSYNDYKDILDCILKHIIGNNKSLEINSSGYKAGLLNPNPSESIIKRYIELGGTSFTIGSDAHTSLHIAYDFDRLNKLLISLGIKSYNIYSGRKPETRQIITVN